MRPSRAQACSLAATLLTGLVVPACHRHGWFKHPGHAPPGHTVPGHATPAPTPARWRVTPAHGPALRVDTGQFLRGALRLTDTAVADAPWPATALVASATVPGGWLFAAADGTVYRADGFLGALTPVAELPARCTALPRGVRSVGSLLVVDTLGHPFAVSATGSVRALPLTRVIAGAFVNDRGALLVTEPGVLHVTEDGGVTFRTVPVPMGVPTGVALVHGVAWIDTTAGPFQWTGSSVARVSPAPDLAAWTDGGTDTDRRAAEFITALTLLPDVPAHAAVRPDGTLAVLTGETVATVDAVHGRVTRLDPAPAAGCALATSDAGLRAVCTHDGWAQAAYAETPTHTWHVLRDEARAEPMGPWVFDDVGGAWLVAAPCTQRPTADPTALCLMDDHGAPREMHTPVPAVPLAMHHGTAVLAARAPTDAHARGNVLRVRNGRVDTVDAPVHAAAAVSVRWDGDALVFWDADTDGVPLRVRGTPTPDGGYRWTTLRAPPGSRAGVTAGGGVTLAFGDTGTAVWQATGDGPFLPATLPLQGTAASIQLDATAPTYCLDAWCRLGGALVWTATATGTRGVVTRARALPADTAGRGTMALSPGTFRCVTAGPASAGPEMDRGVAGPGYGMDWTVDGPRVSARWYGLTLHGTGTGTVAPRVGASPWTGRASVGLTDPLGVLSRCGGTLCQTFVASPAGIHEVTFDDALAGAPATLFARTGGGGLLLAVPGRPGVPAVEAVTVDAGGTPVARRAMALGGPPDQVAPGDLDGRDGLWLPATDGTFTFEPLTGTTAAEPLRVTGLSRASRGCGTGTVRGHIRVTRGLHTVQGQGWSPEPGEWLLEEDLAVVGYGVCVAAMAGGEQRDEAEAERSGAVETEPVRSFMLHATGEDTLVGEAWGHEQRIPLRCTLTPP